MHTEAKFKILRLSAVRRIRKRGRQWKGMGRIAVSYTHLDVYKRQVVRIMMMIVLALFDIAFSSEEI